MIFSNNLKFEEAAAEGTVAGGGGDPAPAPEPAPPADPPPVAAAPEITFPDNWKEGLPEELRNDPSMGVILDVPSLAKSFVSAQKQFGRDKIIVPDQHATEDDWKSVYQKLGLPSQFEEYQVKNPENAEFDDGVVTTLKRAAFEQGILPRQFENLLGTLSEQNKLAMDQHETELNQATEQKIGSLKQEWGTAFQQNAAMVQAIVEEAANSLEMSDEVKSFMNNAVVDGVQLGNHPTFLKMFHFMSQFMSEDQLPKTPFQLDGQTKQDLQTRINEVMGNPEHPYHDAKHPNHQTAVKELQGLFAKLHPAQNQAEGSDIFKSSY